MDRSKILLQVEQLVKPILDKQGYELVTVEYVNEPQGLVLRIFIDSKGGITVDDCTSVNEQVGAALDEKDIIKERYILEVSSPGIERPLAKKEDFERYKGSKVYVKTAVPIDGRKRFTGMLEAVSEDSFTLNCEGKIFSVPYDYVTKAHLVVDDIFS